jgi:RNA polymerase sigma factor (sigma-70 family)
MNILLATWDSNTSGSGGVLYGVKDVAGLSELARAASGGDERDYETLVRALWPNAYRIAWSVLGERGAAEDAAQAACAAICVKLHDLADVRAFPGWAYRIIVSHARDHARARARLRRRETVGYDEAAGVTTRNDPRARLDLEVADDRLDLEAAIGMLPEPLRLALELHYFVGLTSSEVGRALGVPAATVRFRLMIARRRLRPFLSDATAPSAAPKAVS